jgi:hypothetical protein
MCTQFIEHVGFSVVDVGPASRKLDANDKRKKTDVAEHPQVFRHIGLLFNEPLAQRRVALYLVIRKLPSKNPFWYRCSLAQRGES